MEIQTSVYDINITKYLISLALFLLPFSIVLHYNNNKNIKFFG